MAVAAVETTTPPDAGQFSFYGLVPPSAPVTASAAVQAGVCAGCRQREARYGFSRGRGARPGTLCFQCFRSELGRRQDVAERKRRGWNAVQAGLPLADTLEALQTRRRRAQIAARHALAGTTPPPRVAARRPEAS
jgi:hypothetical protein